MKKENGFTLIELLIVLSIVVILGLVFFSGGTSLTDEKVSTVLLKQEGYTNIQFTGYIPYACSDDDWYHTGFVAKNRNGVSISGVVCSSPWGKYGTIRYNTNIP